MTHSKPLRGPQHQRRAVGVTRVVEDRHSIAILLKGINQIMEFQERRNLDATKLRLLTHIGES